MEDIFPKGDIDYSRLRLTPEGYYSVTKRRDGEKMMAFLEQMIPNHFSLKITDTTACVGSDTIRFSQMFEHVDSIELKNDNMRVLENNLKVYNCMNVTLHKGDATKIFNWNTDVLYIDPPWGGPSYYNRDKLEIFISNYRLDIWIEEILKRKKHPSYIILKLPRNYNFARLHYLPNVESYHFYKIRNIMIVLLTTAR